MMLLIVLLRCQACGGWARITVKPVQCPHSASHVHVPQDEQRISAWYQAHYMPEMEVEGHTFQ